MRYNQDITIYKRNRLPPGIISYAIWLCYRFNLGHREIEDLLIARGIIVTGASIRLWCIKFGALYARRLKRSHRGYGDAFCINKGFVRIDGKQHNFWLAVDQDVDVVNVYLQARRGGAAARQFFRRLLRSHGGESQKIVTDKLRSYSVALCELISTTIHSTPEYENNRGEQSHEATRVRERGMRRFKSIRQAQRFVNVHAAVANLYNFGRHLVAAEYCRDFGMSAFNEWSRAVA